MANPQQPELARSRRNPALNPDATETRRQGDSLPATSGPGGPIPEDNQPGHRPEHDQDKPDPAAFVAKVNERAAAVAAEEPEPAPAAATSPSPPPPAAVSRPRPDQPSERAERLAAMAGAPFRAVERVLGAVSRRL